MARRHLQSRLSGAEQDLHAVWEWFVFQSALIGEEAVRTLDVLSAGGSPSQPRYFGKTRDEVNGLFDDQRVELAQVTMLILLAAAEAALRVDYIQRVIQNKKDAVSQDFALLYKKQRQDIRLDEDILDVWKTRSTQGAVKQTISDFKGALKLRHWLAHGRYWKPRLGREYDPQDIFDVCDSLLKGFGVR